MVALISFLLNVVASLFKSKSRLEAENAALRHQLIVLRLISFDRALPMKIFVAPFAPGRLTRRVCAAPQAR
jgi:hypothetical protein